MNQISRRSIIATCALLGIHPAWANPLPARITVGFPPGGTTDVIARLLINMLGAELDRTFIIENRAGASGNIAASLVARTAPDGSNFLFVPSSHATNVSLYKKLSYDTEKDFTTVGLVAATPYVLVVHPSIPATTVPELIALLKNNPNKYQYASASLGTGQHLAAELFKHMADVQMEHIPYKGSSAALPDLLAGRAPIMFDNVAVMSPHIRSSGVRALAVTSSQRSPLMPTLPTIADTLKGYDVQGWFALLAPSRLPADQKKMLNAKLNKIVKSPEFTKKLTELGVEPLSDTPQAGDAFIAKEIRRWAAVIKEANISLD